MNVALWISQVVLAVVFLVSGTAKISMSKERMLATGQTGVAPLPLPLIRFVAAMELVAVVGLIAPRATGTAPVLTGLAAVGLVVVMVGAIVLHATLREFPAVGANTALLLISVFVAWGRLRGY
jgi:uncharacterized membrane protein YphA (DoxX/SURF4 family)